MILIDTSIWVEWLRRPASRPAPEAFDDFATCGPILQEIMQGVAEGGARSDLRWAILSMPILSDPLPHTVFLEAADLFALGRRKGYTIRSSVDCLIAAIAIRNQVPVWHRDRDFGRIARFTALQART